MKKIQPPEWLKELKAHDSDKYRVVYKLRELILIDKPVVEEIKYGGLLYSNDKPYTGIFVYTKHVTLEFSEGASLKDPRDVLNGSGRYRRNIKFFALENVDSKYIRSLLLQASKKAKV